MSGSIKTAADGTVSVLSIVALVLALAALALTVLAYQATALY